MKDRNEKVELTLRSMKEATRKANNIIKDLLDFASLSELKKGNHQLADVVERMLTLTHHQCERNNIKVVRDFFPNVPSIKIDSNRIEQVIVDVILNALFAMHKDGTLTIRITAKKFFPEDALNAGDFADLIPAGAPVVLLDFEDTGPGIKKEDLPRVFDPFFTTRRARGGVGLGLSIARTIMLNHNGLIDLTNLPQGGARARLIFKI